MKKIIIILIAVILGGAAFYFLIQGDQRTISVNISDKSAELGDWQSYTSDKYGFSFKHPKDFTVGELEESDGDSILIQSTESQNSGVQIFIIPFDEPGPITEKRIKQDLRNIKIKNPSRVMLGGSVDTLAFFSEHPAFGKTVEAWFVHEEYLYQVLTYVENQEFLEQILGTLSFN